MKRVVVFKNKIELLLDSLTKQDLEELQKRYGDYRIKEIRREW